MKNIDFISVPLNLGSNKLGVEKGCKAIKNIFYGIRSYSYVRDLGDVHCMSIADISVDDSAVKNIDMIMESCKELANTVRFSLSEEHFPLIVGGDHSLSWGSIAGIASRYPNIGVLYFDAHGDINTEYTTESGNVHGMHMAFLMGKGKVDYVNFYSEGPKIKYENIIFVGTRSLDRGERELVQEKKLYVQSTAKIKNKGALSVANEILEYIEYKSIDQLHISLDIDVLDPLLAPGTGVPVSNGLNFSELELLLVEVFKTGKVVSMDLVEYNPDLDIEDRTSHVVSKIINILNKYI